MHLTAKDAIATALVASGVGPHLLVQQGGNLAVAVGPGSLAATSHQGGLT